MDLREWYTTLEGEQRPHYLAASLPEVAELLRREVDLQPPQRAFAGRQASA